MMDNILGFIEAVKMAAASAREDNSACYVFPLLNHNSATSWAADEDEMEIIEDNRDVHPECSFFIEFIPPDKIEFVRRTKGDEELETMERFTRYMAESQARKDNEDKQ